MKKRYKILLAITFLFIGLLFAVPGEERFETKRIPLHAAFIEESLFFGEGQGIAVPSLLGLNNTAVYAMLKNIAERIQESQIRASYTRTTFLAILGIITAALLVRFKSGLFAFLISGNKNPHFIISQIQIIHKTDGKKRRNYSY